MFTSHWILNLRNNKTKIIMFFFPLKHLTYFHSVWPPVIPHLQFSFRELHYAMPGFYTPDKSLSYYGMACVVGPSVH